MCGRYTLFSEASDIKEYFDVDMPYWAPNYNIVPGVDLPIIRMQNHQRRLLFCRWGFLPRWVKDGKQNGPINARDDTTTITWTKPTDFAFTNLQSEESEETREAIMRKLEELEAQDDEFRSS